MDRQTESPASFPPFVQDLVARGKSEGLREGAREGRLTGKLEGFRAGRLQGKREVVLRLIERSGHPLRDCDRDRVLTCSDPATLDRWIDNVIAGEPLEDALS